MAETLVTQVRNPQGAPLRGEDGVFIDVQPNEEEFREHPPSPCCARTSVWLGDCAAALFSFFTCGRCCKSDPRAVRGRRRFSLPGHRKYLLPPQLPANAGKKTLILDLDETLVHSSFEPVANADFVLSIELEGDTHHVYVLKRPGVDEFLRAVSRRWEVVVFTASVSKYADPLIDILDADKVVSARLFRDDCVQHYGSYVKDLSLMGRDLASTCIVDNSPYSYIFQPDNALAVSSWFNDMSDRQLFDLVPILEQLADAPSVPHFLSNRQHVLLRQHARRVEQETLMQQRALQAMQMQPQLMPGHSLADAPRRQPRGAVEPAEAQPAFLRQKQLEQRKSAEASDAAAARRDSAAAVHDGEVAVEMEALTAAAAAAARAAAAASASASDSSRPPSTTSEQSSAAD